MADTLESRKAALRQKMRELLPRIDPPTEVDARLIDLILIGLAEQRRWRPVILLTLPFGGEVDLSGFARDWLAKGGRIVLPRVLTGDEPLEIREIRSLDEATPGWRGCPGAPENAPLVLPDKIDVCLVPGLAFDRLGRRLGRGRGHFDRLLALRRPDAEVWGVCHPEQVVDEVPAGDHDVAMTGIVTRTGWFLCQGD